MTKFLSKLRGLNHVIRWNFHHHIRNENVSEHSFWVAIYAMSLAYRMNRGEKYMLDVTVAALLHDAEEAITGDLPALVKRHVEWKPVVHRAQLELFGVGDNPIKDFHLMAEGIDVIKAADLFAALVYADEEVRMGNSFFLRIKQELIGSLRNMTFEGDVDLASAVTEVLAELGFDKRDGVDRPVEMSHL